MSSAVLLPTDEDGDVLLERRPRRGHSAIYKQTSTTEQEQEAQESPLVEVRHDAAEHQAEQEQELVLSEVHLECQRPARPAAGTVTAISAGTGTSFVTAFCTTTGEEVVSVQHALSTPLSSVGLQVWRGALLLADFLLHELQLEREWQQERQQQQQQQERQQGRQQELQQQPGASGASGLRGITALELGAGSGLAGLVLSAAARRVFLTDAGAEVLANCQRNAERHQQRHLPLPATGDISSGGGCGGGKCARVVVRQLDWLDPPDFLLPPPEDIAQQQVQQQQVGQQEQMQQQQSVGQRRRQHSPRQQPPAAQQQQHAQVFADTGSGSCMDRAVQGALQVGTDAGAGPFAWHPEDLADLQRLDLLLAADPVYEDNLTECFMRSAVLLMRHTARHSGRSPRLLVALERRIVFTWTDLEGPRAPAYDYWRSLFEAEEGAAEPPAQAEAKQPGSGAASWAGCRAAKAFPASRLEASAPAFPLVGRQLDVSAIPQTLHPYERTEYLELWELRLAGNE